MRVAVATFSRTGGRRVGVRRVGVLKVVDRPFILTVTGVGLEEDQGEFILPVSMLAVSVLALVAPTLAAGATTQPQIGEDVFGLTTRVTTVAAASVTGVLSDIAGPLHSAAYAELIARIRSGASGA